MQIICPNCKMDITKEVFRKIGGSNKRTSEYYSKIGKSGANKRWLKKKQVTDAVSG